MGELLELLKLDAILRRAEWLLLLVVVVLVCVLLHPRVLRAQQWGARAARPSPPSDERLAGSYRRRPR